MIKAVIFDLDNTVYNYDECHKKAMERLEKFVCCKYSIHADEFHRAYGDAKNEVKQLLDNTGSSHNRMLYMQIFLEKIGHSPVEDALELYDIYWNTMLGEMKLFPYVMPLFKRLKSRQILIGVLTDLTAQIKHRKIKTLGISKYIDAIVTSEEAGKEKPSTIAFERIIHKLNFDSNEILMVGDSMEKDIGGAMAVGMNSMLFSVDDKSIMDKKVMEFIDERVDKK